VDKLFGFLVYVGAVCLGQMLAVKMYSDWFRSSTGGTAPVPDQAIQFVMFVVSLGVGWLFTKLLPDD
jgi:hypothetical protein